MYSCTGIYLPEYSCNLCKLYTVVHEYLYTVAQVGSVSVAELLYRSNLIAVVAGGRNPK